MFSLKNNCSYVLGTDGNTFTLIIDQEDRYFNTAFFMKQVRIKTGNTEYTIGKNFLINGVLQTLPYQTNGLFVRIDGLYIKFDHPSFTVFFDGSMLLKLRICSSGYTGLCALKNNTNIAFPFKSLLANDAACSI
jgi:hypothetical protein